MESQYENVIAPKRRTRANACDASPRNNIGARIEGSLEDNITSGAWRKEVLVESHPFERTPKVVGGTNEDLD